MKLDQFLCFMVILGLLFAFIWNDLHQPDPPIMIHYKVDDVVIDTKVYSGVSMREEGTNLIIHLKRRQS